MQTRVQVSVTCFGESWVYRKVLGNSGVVVRSGGLRRIIRICGDFQFFFVNIARFILFSELSVFHIEGDLNIRFFLLAQPAPCRQQKGFVALDKRVR